MCLYGVVGADFEVVILGGIRPSHMAHYKNCRDAKEWVHVSMRAHPLLSSDHAACLRWSCMAEGLPSCFACVNGSGSSKAALLRA